MSSHGDVTNTCYSKIRLFELLQYSTVFAAHLEAIIISFKLLLINIIDETLEMLSRVLSSRDYAITVSCVFSLII